MCKSPIAVDLVHTGGSVLTPVLGTIVHIDAAVLARPAGRADTSVAAGVIQHAASSVVARLLTEERPLNRHVVN